MYTEVFICFFFLVLAIVIVGFAWGGLCRKGGKVQPSPTSPLRLADLRPSPNQKVFLRCFTSGKIKKIGMCFFKIEEVCET